MDLNLSCLVLDHFHTLRRPSMLVLRIRRMCWNSGEITRDCQFHRRAQRENTQQKKCRMPQQGTRRTERMAETHTHARVGDRKDRHEKTTRKRGREDRFRHKIITQNTCGSSPRLPASQHARTVALTERRRQAEGRFCVWVLVAFCTKPGNPRCGPSLGDTTRHVFSHPRATASTADIGTASKLLGLQVSSRVPLSLPRPTSITNINQLHRWP